MHSGWAFDSSIFRHLMQALRAVALILYLLAIGAALVLGFEDILDWVK